MSAAWMEVTLHDDSLQLVNLAKAETIAPLKVPYRGMVTIISFPGEGRNYYYVKEPYEEVRERLFRT